MFVVFVRKKKQNLKYGILPAKEVEAIPRDTFFVDIISPYKIRREGHEIPLIIKALTIIDPATEWFEMVQYNDKKSATIANLDPRCSEPISL